jgi:ribosomal protein S12 methylthiotransferase
MNRRGDAATYLELVRSIRSRFEGRCMLRSTFLTGFPGETEADFQELRAFQDEACLDWVGTFPWSREEGTPAYSMKSRVPKKVAQDRQARIEAAQIPITAARLATFIGTECDILIEEVIEGEELSIGRGWMQAPEVDGLTVVRGHYQPGTLLPCRIVAVNGVDLEAVAVRRSASAERDSEAQVLRNPSSI